IQGGVNGLQFHTDDGGEVCGNADVFFKSGEKTGEGDAHGIKSRRQLVTLKHAARVGEQTQRGHAAWRLGRELHTCAHLRRASVVAYPSCKLAKHRLRLRRQRFARQKDDRSSQDQGPQGSESPLFHVSYLPPPGLAVAVLIACGAFTVKSAVREIV